MKRNGPRVLAGGSGRAYSLSGKQLGSVFKKLKHAAVVRPNNDTPEHLPQRKKDLNTHKNLCTNVCSSFIDNSQHGYNLEVLQWVNS